MSDPRKIHSGRIELPPLEDAWAYGTFEGAEYATLRDGAAMTFAERLCWVEEMLAFVHALEAGRPTAPRAAEDR